jgi:hypothetical protein
MEWWQIQELMWTTAGILASLVVVFGLTLRFAIKPFLGDLARLRDGKKAASDLRLDRLEEKMEVLDSSVGRLADTLEFDRQLEAGDADLENRPGG